jgi:hypothetical protein
MTVELAVDDRRDGWTVACSCGAESDFCRSKTDAARWGWRHRGADPRGEHVLGRVTWNIRLQCEPEEGLYQ